jgi:hypothetical protein
MMESRPTKTAIGIRIVINIPELIAEEVVVAPATVVAPVPVTAGPVVAAAVEP